MAKVGRRSTSEIRAAVEALPDDARLLLAVSGGCDSMVLLDAVARWKPAVIAGVATFDHGTGAFARDAVELVRDVTKEKDIRFVHGTASDLAPTEAAWRRARWEFLRASAALLRARVATAHTSDDQVETVFIRLLRDSGPRGLAGLLADSDVVRPFLRVQRVACRHHAAEFSVPFLEDPSNQSRRYLRNRVRLDLLPACERVRPGFSAELLSLSQRAAEWRRDVEARVAVLAPRREKGSVFVPSEGVLAYEIDARALLWPAIAAHAGIALDRRGTERLAAFSTEGSGVRRIQLAGGHEVIRRPKAFEIRPANSG